MRTATVLLLLVLPTGLFAAEPDIFARGEGIGLGPEIPANERGILCLAFDAQGCLYGGTTGRAAHFFVCDLQKDQVRSLARLPGGVGLAYGLIALPDGSFIGGTQADPTGIAAGTDPKAIGHLYRFTPAGDGCKVEDLGVPVKGQGIFTLAYAAKTGEILGNTWPDGHFFTYDVKTKEVKDHGAIAGHRRFETPQYAALIDKNKTYPRQVSRAIAVDPATGAYTGGATGLLYRYDFDSKKLEKTTLQLPAAAGRESWTSLDAAMVFARGQGDDAYATLMGGTSDGHILELRIYSKTKMQLRPRGKPLTEGGIQGLAAVPQTEGDAQAVVGVGGATEGMPRAFRFNRGGGTSSVAPGGIPRVDGQLSMVGFGVILADGKGNVWAGERDRIGRLVRYSLEAKAPVKPRRPPPAKPEGSDAEPPAKLPCHIVFAPEGTTTEASGYTAIEVGTDGLVYVGAARYGDYAWLLRFDPAKKPTFMDKVVSMKELTGERLQGISTQGKIHAKILVGSDGKIWFASKQAHEVFDSRPEYGQLDGYPGGHLCWFDPKSGFSKSLGILKRQEGLMGGALDEKRGKLYYRSEPKNHFLVYDLKTGDVQDRGNLGAAGRYMASDKNGVVYTVGRAATLCRYDPQTGYVEDLAVRVEGEGGWTPPYVLLMGPNGKLYGVAAGHASIMEFDVARAKDGQVAMKNVAAAAPPGMPVRDIHAAVFGQDGLLWYPLNTIGPLEKGGKAQAHLRIMRFDPASGKAATAGVPEIVGLDESKVKHVYVRGDKYELDHMQGAAIGPDGSLYLMDIYPQLNVACFPRLTAKK